MDVKLPTVMKIVLLFFTTANFIETKRLSVFPRVGRLSIHPESQENWEIDGPVLEKRMKMSMFPSVGRAQLTEDDFRQYFRSTGLAPGTKRLRMTNFPRVGRSLDTMRDDIPENIVDANLDNRKLPRCSCILEKNGYPFQLGKKKMTYCAMREKQTKEIYGQFGAEPDMEPITVPSWIG